MTQKNKFFFGLHRFFGVALLALFLSSCAKQKTKDEMSFEELKENAFVALEKKHLEDAAEYLETMISQHAEKPNIATYKILLADTLFRLEKYPAAHELYEHYNQFYPSDEKAEYAKYQSILAQFNQTLRPDCDQTPTENAIKLCREYLNDNSYITYRSDVISVQQTCQRKIIDKEVYIFDFYVHQKKYAAAEKRLESLKEKYLPNNPSLEARLLFLESKLAHRQRNKELVAKNLQILASKFPDSEFLEKGNALIAKKVPFLF